MAELAGYARFRDAMERAHTTIPDSARAEREPAAAGGAAASPSS
ncbi:hypothetical protein [Streptomyces aureus]|nr:hypothetical protein [Streptomyces aureus]